MQIGERNNVSDLEKQAFYKFIRTPYIVNPIAMAIRRFLESYSTGIWSI